MAHAKQHKGGSAGRDTNETESSTSTTTWVILAAVLLALIGVGAFMMSGDQIATLDVSDASAVKRVFFSGSPHLVLCQTTRPDRDEILNRVSQAGIVLSSSAGGRVTVLTANCTAPLPSGRSILRRWKSALTGPKGRLPSPLAFAVANGADPVLIPPKILKGRAASAGTSAALAPDVKALVDNVRSATSPRKVKRIKTPSGISDCAGGSRHCAVLLYSLPLPPTKTEDIWTPGLDGSLALNAARGSHRDVQFAVMNTTKNSLKGVPAGLTHLLPAGIGRRRSPAQLSAALGGEATGAVLVLSTLGETCVGGEPSAPHASRGRHLATVFPFAGEVSEGVLSRAVAAARADVAADTCPPAEAQPATAYPLALAEGGQAPQVEGLVGSLSVRVHRQTLKVGKRGGKKTPPRPSTPTPTPTPVSEDRPESSQATVPPSPQQTEAERAAQAAAELATRQAMEAQAAQTLPQAVEEEGEEEWEEEEDAEEIEL